MRPRSILIIGGGIGGLTAAIALRARGFVVTVIERDPEWSVYGVGIIQQSNVIRAMAQLGLIDEYVSTGVGFDAVEVYAPNGMRVARVPTPRLVDGYPANMGIGRRALHKLLGDRTIGAGAKVLLGVTATELADDGVGADVTLSNGTRERFGLVVGADGIYSQVRDRIFPAAPRPEFTGQAVWRYNLPRPADLDALHAYNGPTGVGLVPISRELMYIYVTTPEPDNPRYPREGLAAKMREKMATCAPLIRELAEQVTDDDGVVYRPLEALLIDGPWHRGRIVLLGDAVHATTPHLGQGAGMAIEDSLVLAEELDRHDDVETALIAYRDRRFDRCAYIVRSSIAICMGQIGKGPAVDNAKATHEMFEMVAKPI